MRANGQITLSGWGNFPVRRCRLARPRDEDALRALLTDGPVIPRGAGRAYGDSALGAGLTVSTAGFDRMLRFDAETGALTVEAGVLLADIVAALLPRGWFPPVAPGTRYVTVGGMIAADVHGKNHRSDGSFGRHVPWLDLMGADGVVRQLSAEEEPELYDATIGGMGLTGVILRACVAMRRVETAWMRQETVVLPDPGSALATLEESGGWSHSIAWIDELASGEARGRSLVYRGEHAKLADLDPSRAAAPLDAPAKRRLGVPVTPPVPLVSRAAVRAMNALRYRAGARGPREALVHWEEFFFPLDALSGWNRLYGRRGFLQYQCVVPLDRAESGVMALIGQCRAAGLPPWLATLKRFGPGRGGISFPMEGYSLALDFPVTRPVLALLDRLDRIVLDHGGRFYLAKDARLDRETLAAADPRVAGFRRLRQRTGAAERFVSTQSERLEL